MTSNLGSQYLLEGISDAGEISDEARASVMQLLQVTFRPEFLNRLDEVVFYKPLTKEDIGKIVDLLLVGLGARLKDKSLNLKITQEAKNHIIQSSFDPVYGARPMKRYLQRNVETLIARAILSSDLAMGDTLTVDVKDNTLTVQKSN